ncbi:annexin [Haliangium sp.]|uniref:annexin n=1 Tax=Haliangium sp. TaxID=2663208 RepID=UPI003D11658A
MDAAHRGTEPPELRRATPMQADAPEAAHAQQQGKPSRDGAARGPVQTATGHATVVQKQEDETSPPTSADADAQALYEAMDGWGTDEERIFSLLEGKSVSHLKAVRTRYQARYGAALESDLSSDLGGTDLKRALSALYPALPLYARLQRHLSLWGDNEDAMVQVIESANAADLAEARGDARLRPLLKQELNHRQYYRVCKLIWPDETYRNVVELIRGAAGSFGDDEEIVYMAALELGAGDRARLWRENRQLFSYLSGYTDDPARIDPNSEYGRMQTMLTGTRAEALQAGMEAATEGLGTSDELLAAVAKETGEAAQDEAAIRSILAAGKMPGGAPLSEQKRAELQAALAQLGGVKEQLLSAQFEDGELKSDSFLGQLQGDVSEAELRAFSAQMGVSEFDRAKQMILGAPSLFGDDEDAIYRAIELVADPAMRQALMADREVQAALDDALNQEEKDRADSYASGDTFAIALHKIEQCDGFWGDDEAKLFTVLMSLGKDDRARLAGERPPEFLGTYEDLSKDEQDAVEEILRTGRLSTDTALRCASAGPGTDEQLIDQSFDRLQSGERFQHRLGYALSHGYTVSEEFVAADEQRDAIAAFQSVTSRLAPELATDDLNRALDHLLGAPTLMEYSHPEGAELTAFILRQRVIDKGSTRNGTFGEWFIDRFSDSGGASDEAEIAARSSYQQAVADGQVSDQELAVLGFLEKEFAGTHEEYLAAAGMVGEIASTVGAIAAAIIVTAVTGGTAGPGAAAALASYFGVSQTAVAATLAATAAGSAKVAIQETVGEEHYDAGESGAQDFLVGGVDGVMTVLSAGVAKSLQAAFSRMVGLRGAALTAEMSVSVVSATEVGMGQLGRRFATGGIRAGIEGMLGGAAGELVLTAMDEETWRKSLWDTVVSFGAALLRGAFIGGVTGVVTGGAMEALSFVVGKARLPGLLAQMQRAGVAPDRLDALTIDQARLVGRIDDALSKGNRERAVAMWRSLSKEIDADTATGIRKGLFQLDAGLDDAARMSPEDMISRVKSRITEAGDQTFELTYSDDQIRRLIDEGRARGLDDKTIEDWIFVGARKDKPKGGEVVKKHLGPDEVVEQMDNYVNDVALRGYPYLFESMEQFTAFKNDLRELLRSAGVPADDVRIQGSALRNPEARDIDVGVFLSDEAFHKLADDVLAPFKARAEAHPGTRAPKTTTNSSANSKMGVWNRILCQEWMATRSTRTYALWPMATELASTYRS